MGVLIFNSQDSFTYNIVESLRIIGLQDIQIVQEQSVLTEILPAYSHIILGPGPGLPEDHPGLFNILDQISESQSVLGICLGHEAIALHAGGRIRQTGRVFHGDLAQVIPMCMDNPLFKEVTIPFQAGLYHSWIVDEETLPDVFAVTCRSDLGLIMGLRHKEKNLFGFQFHPESYRTTEGQKLLSNWIEITF